MQYGITTGATAAAAAKAAAIAIQGEPVDRVVIPTPIGIRFEVPVKSTKKIDANTAQTVAVKDAGQDIDVTDKMDIVATVKLTDDGKIAGFARISGLRKIHVFRRKMRRLYQIFDKLDWPIPRRTKWD